MPLQPPEYPTVYSLFESTGYFELACSKALFTAYHWNIALADTSLPLEQANAAATHLWLVMLVRKRRSTDTLSGGNGDEDDEALGSQSSYLGSIAIAIVLEKGPYAVEGSLQRCTAIRVSR